MAKKHTSLAIEGERARRASQFLRQNWPELPETDPATFWDTIEGECDFVEMVDQAMQTADDFRAIADQRKRRAEELAISAKDMAAKADVIEARIQQALEEIGVPSLKRPGFLLSVPESGTTKVTIINEDALPRPYWRQPEPPAPKPDLVKIGEALKNGDAKTKAELAPAAVLSNGAPKMRVKRY